MSIVGGHISLSLRHNNHTTQAYRGPFSSISDKKPDIVVVEMQTTIQAQGQVHDVYRDILWIECKAPSEGAPSGWKQLMQDSAERLEVAHPNRMLYVIHAIGMKWMFFQWDPFNQQSPLQLLAHNQRDAWTIHPRYRYETALAGQRHVTQRSPTLPPDLIDTQRAYSLDFWTPHPNGQQALHWGDMLLLEAAFALVQNTQYQGENPDEFN